MSDLVLDQKTNSDHRVANTVKVNDTLFMAAQKKKVTKQDILTNEQQMVVIYSTAGY